MSDLQNSEHPAVPVNNMSARDEREEQKKKKRFVCFYFMPLKCCSWLTIAFELLYFVHAGVEDRC